MEKNQKEGSLIGGKKEKRLKHLIMQTSSFTEKVAGDGVAGQAL